MATNDMTSGGVPDDGFDVAELGQGSLELLILRITGLEVFTRIVVSGLEFTNGHWLHEHV